MLWLLHHIMMIMLNYFSGIVGRQKTFCLISSRDHCQRSSPLHISNTPGAGFDTAWNLSLTFFEWRFAVVATTTSLCHWISCQTFFNTPYYENAKYLQFEWLKQRACYWSFYQWNMKRKEVKWNLENTLIHTSLKYTCVGIGQINS